MTTMLAAGDDSEWMTWATQALSADKPKSSGLGAFEWPGPVVSGSRTLILDEARHRTSSLKHETMRLAFRQLTATGTIQSGPTVVAATPGIAAVAAAHWCRVLALPR